MMQLQLVKKSTGIEEMSTETDRNHDGKTEKSDNQSLGERGRTLTKHSLVEPEKKT